MPLTECPAQLSLCHTLFCSLRKHVRADGVQRKGSPRLHHLISVNVICRSVRTCLAVSPRAHVLPQNTGTERKNNPSTFFFLETVQ